MARPGQRWFRAGIIIAAILVALFFGVRFGLRSDFAAGRVAARIEQVARTPVRIGQIDLGLTGSTIYDLQFLEPEAPAGSPPWATVTAINTDLTLTQLYREEFQGGTITLRGPKLTFRLDQNNQLISQLPLPDLGDRPWPEIRIVAGQLRFTRPNLPEALYTNVNGTIHKDGEKITLQAEVVDTELGKWIVTGERTKVGDPFQFTFHSNAVPATKEKLRRLPFVRPGVWDQVSVDGELQVDAVAHFNLQDRERTVQYQIAIAPQKVTVVVPSIELTTIDSVGKVTIQDGVVRLINVRGQTSSGAIHVNAILNLAGPIPDLRFVVGAERLMLHQLPRSWGLPATESRLIGKADLSLTFENGKLKTSGKGEGVIETLSLKTQEVTLVPDEQRGFRFKIGK